MTKTEAENRAKEAADLTRRINAGASYWEAVEEGLTLHRIKFRWNDVATGAINSASGPGPIETAQIWASNEAPLQEVFDLLWPEGPHTSVFTNECCIYRSWYELLGSDWGRDGGLETPLSEAAVDFLRAAYRVGVNPLPDFRRAGFAAEFNGGVVSLRKYGLRPVRVAIPAAPPRPEF